MSIKHAENCMCFHCIREMKANSKAIKAEREAMDPWPEGNETMIAAMRQLKENGIIDIPSLLRG